ncbi:hypothetical protein HPB50_026606 [Hyalomma asiaticum]|uniref:Uncharacterized protein n=1 Tax=Hyalomma asiaticum TaxID=266040 RepID=A0ACB7TPX7_HYAAI|nr:hypothetical protein HPB50_026606 [Hyalomma asiaticum]
MGNLLRQGLSYSRRALTDREKKLIRNSWRKFCEKNPDYGVRIFISMFAKHPEYLQLFPRFRDKELRTLRNDAKFRAHACAVGHQLSAIVECIEDEEVLVELIRKNAANHLPRAGVRPSNFESLSEAALEQMMASNKALMTPATVCAWNKLFEKMNRITRSVYEEADDFTTTTQATSTEDDVSQIEAVATSAELPQADASLVPSGRNPTEAPLTVKGARSSMLENLTREGQNTAPGTSRVHNVVPARNVSERSLRSAVLREGGRAPSEIVHRPVGETLKPTQALVNKAGARQTPKAAPPNSFRSALPSER